MLDTVARQNARSGSVTRSCRVAIASGKGGVGKTWLAITLSQALAALGGNVLLLDCDFGLANLDVQLGLTPERDLACVLAGEAPLEHAILRHQPGFSVLPGRSGSGVLAGVASSRLDMLLDEVAALPYSIVVADLGAGLAAQNRRIACWADVLLVMATDEPTSLTDAYAVLKLHAADRARAGTAQVVVNQAPSVAAGQRTYGTLARVCRHFLGYEPALAGIVRRDDHVREAIRRQEALLTRHPNCHAAEDVGALARALLASPAYAASRRAM